MRILWITNIKLPELSKYLGEKPLPIGSWLNSALNEIKKYNWIELAVATFDNRKDLYQTVIDGVTYFLLPLNNKNPQKYQKFLEKEWRKVNELFTPDIVHIHGTELPHTLAWVKACGNKNVCVSIQGLTSVISRYYSSHSWLDYIPLSFRDSVKLDWISRQKQMFRKRGLYEIALLKSVSHVFGRTEWDKSHLWAINPDATYYHVGETLRPSFYRHKWEFKNCIPHTIFISQAQYPIKGLHQVLRALPIVLRHYPDTIIKIGGGNILRAPWYRKGSYAKIIERLIKKNHLEHHIEFLGALDEHQMCNEYLKCNLFLLPSAIENSPNSLGEAQVLGVPYLTTFCGGTPEIVQGEIGNLYRFEELEELAFKICNKFASSQKENTHASLDLSMYDPEINTQQLLSAYTSILSCKQK